MREDFLLLVPGNRVYVERDDGEVVDCEVKYSPWQLRHGVWVIGLRGLAGGYSLDRVRGRVPAEEAAERSPSPIGPRVPNAEDRTCLVP